MVASLDSNARSRRLTSVTSRISTAAPTALPCTTNGSVRSSTAAPPASTSMRMLDPPANESRTWLASSCASNGSPISGLVIVTRLWPSNSEASPIRW